MLLFRDLEYFVSLLNVDLPEGIGITLIDPALNIQSYCVEGENFELLGPEVKMSAHNHHLILRT